MQGYVNLDLQMHGSKDIYVSSIFETSHKSKIKMIGKNDDQECFPFKTVLSILLISAITHRLRHHTCEAPKRKKISLYRQIDEETLTWMQLNNSKLN